jgi:alpha-1,2-mannosyltransferase
MRVDNVDKPATAPARRRVSFADRSALERQYFDPEGSKLIRSARRIGDKFGHGPALLTAVVIVLLVLSGVAKLRPVGESLRSPNAYRKDFIQEYLLGRALLEGTDPYLPISDLAAKLIGPIPVRVFIHPTPHPPPVAIVSLPLGLLSYSQAAAAWAFFELVCLVFSICLLLRYFDRSSTAISMIVTTLAAMGWAPVWTEIVLGQFMIPLLALLTCSWLALRSDKNTAGGALLGLVIGLKLMAWPVLIFLALRRKWSAVASGIAVAAVANLFAVFLMNFHTVMRYYSTVGKSVFMIYKAAEYNISAWSIGWKVFDGMGTSVDYSFTAPPLIHSPILAQVVSVALPVLLLFVGVALANKSDNLDTSFAILVCVSILVNPVAWTHYLVLMAIPIVISVKRLAERKFPKHESYGLVALVLLFGIPPKVLDAAQLLSVVAPVREGQMIVVPFAGGLITLYFTLCTLGMMWFLRLQDRKHVEDQQCANSRTASI